MKGKAVPFDTKRYLIHVYLTQGFQAVSPIAIQYGVRPRLISEWTRAMGVKGKRGREPGKHKQQRTHSDPRWQRAVEIGPVIA